MRVGSTGDESRGIKPVNLRVIESYCVLFKMFNLIF